MYRIINENIELILKQIDRKGAIQVYVSLRERLHKGNITNDQEFIKDFKGFWTMNAARPDHDFFEKYFHYLEKNKKNQRIPLLDVIKILYNNTKNHKVYFSFSSKLVHMINPNKPIYDARIQSFYFLPNFSDKRSYEDKIGIIDKNYKFLENEYNRVIEKNILDSSINLFYERFGYRDNITYVKVIDYLIWTLVDSLQSGYDHKHKRFVPYGTHPKSAFGGTSFMLGTLDERESEKHERSA